MHRPLKPVLSVTFVAILWLVGLQVVWPFLPPGAELKGAVEAPPSVRWDWASIRSKATFRAIEKWYDAHVGLRNFWVRLDNQLTFSFFAEIPSHPDGARVVAGPDDWFFEPQYIRDAVKPRDLDDAQLRKYAQHVRSIQDKLARHGVPFHIIVAPNKAELYPERVPAGYVVRGRPNNVMTNFERGRVFFYEAGVNFYDGPARFDEWQRTGVTDLFARSGTHWSYDSAFRVLHEVREQLNPHLRRPIPELKLAKRTIGAPRLNDRDLLNLLNLLNSGVHEHELPFPELIQQKTVPKDQLPRILWINDSFGWTLIDLLYSANAAQASESLYYFQSCYRLQPPPHGYKLIPEMDLKKIHWESFLKSYDAIIMVWTNIAYEHFGWGFFESVDQQLK